MTLNKNKLKILVIEDAPGDVFLIKFYLEELDPDYYVISDVDNLKDAHEKLANESFDIILLDLHLPDSEGLVTLTSTIEKFPEEVFIVMTGLSDQTIGLEAVRNGAQDFLVKGRLDSKALDSSIKFAFQRSELKRSVKIFKHALKVMEQIHDFRVAIYDTIDNTIDHSEQLPVFFGSNETLETIDDFSNFFKEDGVSKIKECIEHIKDNEVSVLENLTYNNTDFILKFSKSEKLKDFIIISVSKA